MDLVVDGECGSQRFLVYLQPQSVPWRVTIDLRGLTWCEPVGLVGIAAFAERYLLRDDRVVVIRPRDDSRARYLARMRLGSVLEALGAEHDLPTVRERQLSDALLELTPFDGARGAGSLAAHVHGVVSQYDIEAANALHSGLCEAGQNVAHHSGRQRGFLAAQRTHNGRRLLFAVGDSGRGMRYTLRERGAKSDRDALLLALRRGVSRCSDVGRGVGLPDVLELVLGLSGSLHLASGGACVTVRDGRFTMGRADRHFRGTLLQGLVHPRATVLNSL
ncbi:MAG: hypothetical protein M3P96_02955 [Actinomycetota bacterium]|nr:hypothetical protein [Actinomycetota bacterium]